MTGPAYHGPEKTSNRPIAAWEHACVNCGHVFGIDPPGVDERCPKCMSLARVHRPVSSAASMCRCERPEVGPGIYPRCLTCDGRIDPPANTSTAASGGHVSHASHRMNNDLRYRDENHPMQWQFTPDYVLDLVRADLGGIIGLDPCTTADNPVDALWFYTAASDGLAQTWEGWASIFCNPPYGKAREPWVNRCIEAGEWSSVILLMPASTDTRIFQRAAESAQAVVFIRGRVKFGTLRPNRRQHAASHPSALLGWNTDLAACSQLGWRAAA